MTTFRETYNWMRRALLAEREVERLRRECQQAFDALAFSYGGTVPDQYDEPEDKALASAMHRLYALGFGRRAH